MYSQEVQPTVPTRVDFSRPLKYDSYPCRLQSTAGKELQNRESRVRIPSGQGVSCLKTSFTVFSRTDYELELSSRPVAARTRVGWTYSKMRTRPHQLRRVAISSLLRSGISKPAESENYVLKSHTFRPRRDCAARAASRFADLRPVGRRVDRSPPLPTAT